MLTRRRLVLFTLAALGALALRAACGGEPAASVTFLDVGQGDAVLVRSADGHVALIDGGPAPRGLADRLLELGVTKVEVVVASHHHSDHYGGLAEVVERFDPILFVASGSDLATPAYVRLLRAVQGSPRTSVLRPQSTGRQVELGEHLKLMVLPMPPLDPANENNNSVGVRVEAGGDAVLLTGDSETAERAWWREHCPQFLEDCRVLKAPHHGARNGLDAAFLDLVRPRTVAISCGRDNSYGHPHAAALRLLRDRGVEVLRTDELGSITIELGVR